MDKNTCRKELLRRRKSLMPKYKEAFSQALEDFLLDLPPMKIFTYYSMEDEIPTREAIEKILGHHQVYLPTCLPKEKRMVPCPLQDLEDLVAGAFGIIESIRPPYAGPLDLVLVPGLAFTRTGYRLGYGGGYYDRFLEKSQAFSLGLCLQEQIMDRLPIDDHDQPVDGLFTEKGLIPIKDGNKSFQSFLSRL